MNLEERVINLEKRVADLQEITKNKPKRDWSIYFTIFFACFFGTLLLTFILGLLGY